MFSISMHCFLLSTFPPRACLPQMPLVYTLKLCFVILYFKIFTMLFILIAYFSGLSQDILSIRGKVLV